MYYDDEEIYDSELYHEIYDTESFHVCENCDAYAVCEYGDHFDTPCEAFEWDEHKLWQHIHDALKEK